jgi:hypothetical protein
MGVKRLPQQFRPPTPTLALPRQGGGNNSGLARRLSRLTP